MNTGRNWTRRSIEELIDDFLKRQKAPTPTSPLQYTIIQGNDGSSFVNLGISERPTPKPFYAYFVNTQTQGRTPVTNDIKETCVELYYADTDDLVHRAYYTYFPVTAAYGKYKKELPYAYVIPVDSITPTFTYTDTCYKMTRRRTDLDLPCISNYERSNTSFSAQVTASNIHSVSTTAVTLMKPLALYFGSNNENLTAIRQLNDKIRDSILTPLNKTRATVLLSSVVISDTDIQTTTGVTNFQSLTY